MSAKEEFLMRSSSGITNVSTGDISCKTICVSDVVKTPNSIDYDNDRICNTCYKEDVCMYKGELAQAAKEITKISERENVFINTRIICSKWLGTTITKPNIYNNLKTEYLEEDYIKSR